MMLFNVRNTAGRELLLFDFALYAEVFNQKEISEIYLQGLDLNAQ